MCQQLSLYVLSWMRLAVSMGDVCGVDMLAEHLHTQYTYLCLRVCVCMCMCVS